MSLLILTDPVGVEAVEIVCSIDDEKLGEGVGPVVVAVRFMVDWIAVAAAVHAEVLEVDSLPKVGEDKDEFGKGEDDNCVTEYRLYDDAGDGTSGTV